MSTTSEEHLMEMSQRMEQFSVAYVRAVAATAGYSTYIPEPDDDSVDLGLAARGGGGTTRSPRLEMQLKCTYCGVLDDAEIKYPLKIKNYEDLRPDNVLVPRILVVVIVPEALDGWLAHSEDSLSLHNCGYWMSLRGLGETVNTHSKTVALPRAQQYTVKQVQQIMSRIAGGGLP